MKKPPSKIPGPRPKKFAKLTLCCLVCLVIYGCAATPDTAPCQTALDSLAHDHGRQVASMQAAQELLTQRMDSLIAATSALRATRDSLQQWLDAPMRQTDFGTTIIHRQP